MKGFLILFEQTSREKTSRFRSICVKCPLESDPIVMIQNEKKKRDEFLSDFLENDLWTNMRGSFRLVDYKNLVGRCFLQKMELLIACLS